MMPSTAVESNEPIDDGLPPEAVKAPAWLLNRRERRIDAESSVESSNEETAAESTISWPSPPALPRVKRKPKTPNIVVATSDTRPTLPKDTWFSQWVSRQGLIGVGVSLFLHATVLAALAFIVISHISNHDDVPIFGNAIDTDEVGGDLTLDSGESIDAGGSSPLQMEDLSKAMETIGAGAAVGESMQVNGSGKGKGGGDGDGIGTGGLSLNVPGHAQSKGSFSAWSDPRDPDPGKSYHIVIQIRLPRTVKKYRTADLSGLVTGTDTYRQEIRYKAGESVPVENGVVEIRIEVPGGGVRVRDTIVVESKMLREKQKFEIVF